MWGWLAQATDAAGVTGVFIQYSALGVIALLALLAVRVLFQREVKAHDEARERADRLEEELRQLNRTVQERYVTTLTEATRTMGALLDEIKRERR